MFLRRTVLSTALAGALATLGCGEAPTPTALTDVPAPNFAVEGTGWFEDNRTVNDACNGELVDFTALRKEVFTTTFDANGGGHFGLHRTWRGTGVGRTTGTQYILNWPHEIQESFTAMPHTFSRRIANNLVSKGSADNRIFSLTVHFTINADGEVISDVNDRRLTCQG